MIPIDNAKRKALLFIRHLALWKELPAETDWYEVELRPSELRHVRVFPRAQWRKLARGNFSVPAVAERMEKQQSGIEPSFRAKIDAIGDRVLREDPDLGAVVLIGINETEPITVLDGNHRLMAAILASPHNIGRLRFLCGLSSSDERVLLVQHQSRHVDAIREERFGSTWCATLKPNWRACCKTRDSTRFFGTHQSKGRKGGKGIG
jgi:hypothetical protein